jgi:serine/threonine protein kinase
MFEDAKNVYIVAEALKGNDLITEFSQNWRITEGRCAAVIQQILEAIVYLHSKGLAHNNISSLSVQLIAEGSDQIKLINLDEVSKGITDLNAFLDRIAKTNSDPYVAPELLKGVWSLKNDEWSVGVLLHQLLIGQLPYQSDIAAEMFKKISENRLTNCQTEF